MEFIVEMGAWKMESSDLKKSLEAWRQGRSGGESRLEIEHGLEQSLQSLEALSNEMEFLQTPWVSAAYDLMSEIGASEEYIPLSTVSISPLTSQIRRVASKFSDRLEAVGLSPLDADYFHGINRDILNPSGARPSPEVERLMDAMAQAVRSPASDVPLAVAKSQSALINGFHQRGGPLEGLKSESYEERLENLGRSAREQIALASSRLESAEKMGLPGLEKVQGLVHRAEGLLLTNTRPDVSIPSDGLGVEREVREQARAAHERFEKLKKMDEMLQENLVSVEKFGNMDDPDVAQHMLEEISLHSISHGSRVFLDEAALTSPVVQSMFPEIEKAASHLQDSLHIQTGTLLDLKNVGPKYPDFRHLETLSRALGKLKPGGFIKGL